MSTTFFLAPMAEITHRAFRELVESFGGCDLYFSEMISAGAVLAGGPFEKWYIDAAPKPEKHVFQLVGSDPAVICRAAEYLDKFECAGIDINMGCSAPKIRKTGAGAAWMASIDRAGDLISKVRAVVKRRLSVKLRTGFKDDFDYLARFCRRLEEEGVELITLHPRIVTEKFKRRAKWEYAAMLKKELKISVAGNGDIASASELISKAGECDAVMAGRAAVRMPWIFAEARELEKDLTQRHQTIEPKVRGLQGAEVNIEEVGLRFLELLDKYQPPEFHVSRAMRFFSYFCDNLKWGNHLKNVLNREESLQGMERAWKEFFAVI